MLRHSMESSSGFSASILAHLIAITTFSGTVHIVEPKLTKPIAPGIEVIADVCVTFTSKWRKR